MHPLVLSAVHYIPSAAAGLLSIYIAMKGKDVRHGFTSWSAAVLATIGLYGLLTSDWSTLFIFGFHAVHGWVGAGAMTLLLANMAVRREGLHHALGLAVGVISTISLGMGLVILLGLTPVSTPTSYAQYSVSSTLPGVEAGSYNGVTLTPISSQLNNAIKGTQYIDTSSYRLNVTGLVRHELSLSLGDILILPAYAEVVNLDCVEGWSFAAKWTGFRVTDLLDSAGVLANGTYVEFFCVDGYTTTLPLSYLRENNVLLAYGLNDVQLPPDRGFPLQLVAGGKYGYKWAKWVTGIKLVPGPVEGYWESRGYSDGADVGSFPFG